MEGKLSSKRSVIPRPPILPLPTRALPARALPTRALPARALPVRAPTPIRAPLPVHAPPPAHFAPQHGQAAPFFPPQEGLAPVGLAAGFGGQLLDPADINTVMDGSMRETPWSDEEGTRDAASHRQDVLSTHQYGLPLIQTTHPSFHIPQSLPHAAMTAPYGEYMSEGEAAYSAGTDVAMDDGWGAVRQETQRESLRTTPPPGDAFMSGIFAPDDDSLLRNLSPPRNSNDSGFFLRSPPKFYGGTGAPMYGASL